jgi:hypothetical protein
MSDPEPCSIPLEKLPSSDERIEEDTGYDGHVTLSVNIDSRAEADRPTY